MPDQRAEDVEYESLVVLPAIRLGRLRDAVHKITGDWDQTQRVMEAVERHVERDAYRWGNACPVEGCHHETIWNQQGGWFNCIVHGRQTMTTMLVGFKPVTR